MTILFSCGLCSERVYKESIPNLENRTNQQIQKFYRIITEGLATQADTTIEVLSHRPVNNWRNSKKYLRKMREVDSNVCYDYSPVINIGKVKNIHSFVYTFFSVLNKTMKHRAQVVLCDTLMVSVSAATIMACKISRTPCIDIVTDIPIIYAHNFEGKVSKQQKISYMLSQKVDGYILISAAMNSVINKRQVPFIIMEGCVDVKAYEKIIGNTHKYEKEVCLYAGGIEQANGIDILVKGFIAANVINSELRIYGAGKYVNDMCELISGQSNIKYMGVANNIDVVDAEEKSTLLINPRYTNAEYTKYSFPIKNYEYMVSGTPVLTTNLPGMPEEYRPYVYLLCDETADGIARKIRELLTKPRSELFYKGISAKTWILQNKNNMKQAERIVSFLKIFVRD